MTTRFSPIRFFFVLLSLIIITVFYAEATDLTGNVTDRDHLPLPGVTVSLFEPSDSTTLYKVTDADGKFLFQNLSKQSYYLSASMTGMETVNRQINPDLANDSVLSVDIVMTDNPVMLQEAVVTAIKAAVVAKQDTIEFNADSFHTATNATVNDLLKKLPGVEVGSDGSITSNGKSVTKILVDGKEFFSDDPQMASKNLPSDMVDKVQVIDRKSDLARITGVDDGEEETVINLTVKKEMQNGVFGNVSAGYGTDDRYQASFVINNFHNGNQITLLGGLNNINENGFTDRGRGRFRDFGGSGGITTAQRLGLNFNVGNEEIFRVGGNILYSHSKRDVTRKSATQYLFPDSVSYQEAGSKTTDKGHNLNSDFRIQWKPDDNNTLDFRPRFSFNFRDSEKNDSSILSRDPFHYKAVNRNLNAQNNRGTNYEISGNLIYNHNFASRPGRSFSINAQYSFSNNRQKSLSWSEILYYLLQDSDEELYRFIDNHSWSNSLETRLTWTEPLGNAVNGHFLTLAYRLRYQWNDADQLTFNLDPFEYEYGYGLSNPGDFHPDGIDYDPYLSNRFRNKFFTQEVQLGYKKVSKTLNFEAGLQFSPSSSRSDNLIDSEKSIPVRNVFNISPYANLRFRFGERSSIRANYRARTSQPSMTQLQPVADVSDPLNITIGNPELKPTFTQSLGVHFNDFRTDSQQALMIMLNGSYSINTIVARTVTDPSTGGRTTTYGNVDGNFNIFGMFILNRPFRNRKWRFNVRLNTRYAATPGYINGNFNRTGSLSLSPSGGLTFSADFFQMSVNPTYTFGNINNSLPEQPNRKTHSYGFNSDISFFLPFGLEYNTDISFSDNKGYSTGFDSRQWLWNMQLSYSFLSDKSLTLSLRAYDILAMKKNISRSVSASAITDNEYNDLTRYFMLSLTWNFNSLRNKKKNQDSLEDFPPFPGPPGEMRPQSRNRGERPSGMQRPPMPPGGPGMFP